MWHEKLGEKQVSFRQEICRSDFAQCWLEGEKLWNPRREGGDYVLSSCCPSCNLVLACIWEGTTYCSPGQKPALANELSQKGTTKHGFWYFISEHVCPQRHKFKCYVSLQQQAFNTPKDKKLQPGGMSSTTRLSCSACQLPRQVHLLSTQRFRHRLGTPSTCQWGAVMNQIGRFPAFTEATVWRGRWAV